MGVLLFAQALAVTTVLAQRVGLTDEQVNGANVGMTYAEARERLLELGYAAAPASRDPGRCGARSDICKKYPEAESCAGTGLAPCRFSFKYPRGRVVIVIASGENLIVTSLFGQK